MPQDELNDKPALFIPTYPPPVGFGDDSGLSRPVPDGVPYYLCPGIKVLNAYRPGFPLSLEVTVGNWGGGNTDSLAQVAAWWSPPISGPTIVKPTNFIDFALVQVPPHGGQITSSPLTAVIPADAPPHICLLVKVWHSRDMAPTMKGTNNVPLEVADPANDRHWGQHNIVIVPATGKQIIQFVAPNVMRKRASFDLVVQPLGKKKRLSIPDTKHLSFVDVEARLRLWGQQDDSENIGEKSLRHQVTLEAGEHKNMQLSIELTNPLRPGDAAAFEVLQLSSAATIGGFVILFEAEH